MGGVRACIRNFTVLPLFGSHCFVSYSLQYNVGSASLKGIFNLYPACCDGRLTDFDHGVCIVFIGEGKSSAKITFVDITPCDNQPCSLKRGTEEVVEVQFTPSKK